MLIKCLTHAKQRLHSTANEYKKGYVAVSLNGRDLYLGQLGSPEAKAKYTSRIAEWLAKGRQFPDAPLTINQVIPA